MFIVTINDVILAFDYILRVSVKVDAILSSFFSLVGVISLHHFGLKAATLQ